MVVSFNVGDLNQHITGVGKVADTCVERGQKLPAAIKAATAPIDVADVEMAADLQRVKSALDGQASTLGGMYIALGGRVDTMAQELGRFRDRALTLTEVGTDGVVKIASGADTSKAVQGLDGLMGQSKKPVPAAGGSPQGDPRGKIAGLLAGNSRGGEGPPTPSGGIQTLLPQRDGGTPAPPPPAPPTGGAPSDR